MNIAWIRQNIREPFCGLSHLAGAALAIAATRCAAMDQMIRQPSERYTATPVS
jgi:hypothetical protein